MAPHLERMTELYNRVIFSSRLFYASVFLAAGGGGLLLYNWRFVRSNVSRESAEVIAETIQDQKVHISAKEFTKELLNMLLHDKEVEKLVGMWVYRLLLSIQDDIGVLFVHILQQEQVIAAVNRLADRLVEYLCGSEFIQAKVAQLLIDAICMQSSRDATAQWAYDLVMREDVTEGFAKLVVTALQMEPVVTEAGVLAQQVVNRVLQDPEVIQEAKTVLNETLRDSQLRATAKESLWNIVVPWSSSGKVPDPAQKALKSLDELTASDALTHEERQLLKSMQARIRTGDFPAASTTAPATAPASDAVAATSTEPEPAAPQPAVDSQPSAVREGSSFPRPAQEAPSPAAPQPLRAEPPLAPAEAVAPAPSGEPAVAPASAPPPPEAAREQAAEQEREPPQVVPAQERVQAEDAKERLGDWNAAAASAPEGPMREIPEEPPTPAERAPPAPDVQASVAAAIVQTPAFDVSAPGEHKQQPFPQSAAGPGGVQDTPREAAEPGRAPLEST